MQDWGLRLKQTISTSQAQVSIRCTVIIVSCDVEGALVVAESIESVLRHGLQECDLILLHKCVIDSPELHTPLLPNTRRQIEQHIGT